ncbi:MAG: hypothetical protein ACP5GI_01695 [Sulfolobales archaeon]
MISTAPATTITYVLTSPVQQTSALQTTETTPFLISIIIIAIIIILVVIYVLKRRSS